MSTRASARLAKGKGKRVNTDMDEIHDDLGRDAGDEYVDPKQEQQPPQKRQRATAKSAKGVVRKKQVRGKQGRLAGLVNMPIDIFAEVASHLLPADIISLTRSNKFFRNLLMNRSAIHIWHGAMRNVEGLPPCPPEMSEPHYLSLLFLKTCSMCGAPARVNMDPFLLVRLCKPCRNTHLMPLNAVPLGLMSLVHSSGAIAPPKRRTCSVFLLREEFKELLAEYEEKKLLNDNDALEAWTKERKEILNKRQKLAAVLLRFLNAIELDREQELVDTKAARLSEIKRRLTEMGWTEKDMEFGWWSSHSQAWYALVLQPKPLTDRIWANLQLKLVPLLQTNREERLTMECEQRKRNRQARLSKLFLEIKKKGPSDLELQASNPVTLLSSTMPTIKFTHQGPFPDFAHTLDWPLVKNLYETDSSVAEMEAKFEENRDEIEALVTGWQDRIQAHFVNLVCDGYENQGKVLQPAIVVCDEDSDPPANISDDLKFLLRADSLFYQTPTSDFLKHPLFYGTFLYTGVLTGSHSTYGSADTRLAPDLNHIHWYPEAHEAARQILADMGRPDASYLEMRTVGAVFACGRCHEAQCRSWGGMVQHYVEQKQLHAKIQEDKVHLSDAGITYNDVHSPMMLPDRPVVTDYATKTLEDGSETGGRLQVCKLCEKIPAAGGVLALEPVILKHLLNVHGITEPEVDEHYAPKPFNTGLFGMDGYDSDGSHSDYYFGCDCPFHQVFGDDGHDEYGYGDEDEDDW